MVKATKFHVGPNGPSPCSASQRNCKYGGESGMEDHYATKEEAQAAYDEKLKKEHGLTTTLRKEGGASAASAKVTNKLQEVLTSYAGAAPVKDADYKERLQEALSEAEKAIQEGRFAVIETNWEFYHQEIMDKVLARAAEYDEDEDNLYEEEDPYEEDDLYDDDDRFSEADYLLDAVLDRARAGDLPVTSVESVIHTVHTYPSRKEFEEDLAAPDGYSGVQGEAIFSPLEEGGADTYISTYEDRDQEPANGYRSLLTVYEG